MTVSITHKFVSPKPDSGDADEVSSNAWNDTHDITGLDKASVGLDQVDNTSDADKPVSTATQTALDAKANTADLATVATTGAYSDLSGAPSLAAVATTGAYSDLSGTPTLGTAAALDAGTADGNVVQVQTGGKLPALDGSLLTGLSGGGDMSKSTYDPNNVAGDAFSQDNMADGTTNKNYTATEKTKLAGIEAAADVTDTTNVAAAGAFMKSADDADDITEGASNLFLTTSERSKLSGIEAGADVTDAGNVGSTMHGATGKTTPVDADELALIDSAASNALKKLTWANLKSFFLASTIARREVLTASRTYYVRTDGSDSNDGLTNSSGGAFLTPQKAWNVAITLDLAGFGVTIQFGDGTYTGGLSMSVPPVGGNISIVGNTSTPGNVIFSTTSKDAISLTSVAKVAVSGIKVQTTTSGHGIYCGVAGGQINLGAGMQFGACANNHMYAEQGGYISSFSAYTINGNAQTHIQAQRGGGIDMFGQTITLTGTPAFSTAFAFVSDLGRLVISSVTYSGSATGSRYSANNCGVIDTSGGGASFFPGNSAGSGTNPGTSPYGLYR